MEARGLISGYDGSKPRQVLISKAEWQELKMGGANSNSNAEETNTSGSEPRSFEDSPVKMSDADMSVKYAASSDLKSKSRFNVEL